MKEEEIMARRRIGNINSRRYRGVIERMVEHTLDRGPTVQDDDVIGSYACYWCGNPDPDHESDCVWLALQEAFGQEEKG